MGVKYQLFSYFYFRTALRSNSQKTRALLMRMRRAQAKGYQFFLDSGAFTYQNKAKKMTMPPPREYFNEYKDFILDYGDLFEIIAEFDVDGSVVDPDTGEMMTIDVVDKWTNELLDLEGIGHRIMPVYHSRTRNLDWLRGWLLDPKSPYLGCGSDNIEGNGALIAQAHRYGKFIHGFGQTRIKTDMKYLAFDSVDSSTWLRADKYGGTMLFWQNKLVVLDHLHKDQRKLYRQYYERWGLDYKKILTDDLYENRKATIICWRELANDFERRWYIRTQGQYPYLLQYRLKHGRMPDVHPMENQ